MEKLKQKRVKKTSGNSSLPPSKSFKPTWKPSPVSRVDAASPRHGQGGRQLSAQPDQVVVARARTCPHCQAAVAMGEQQLRGIYERIDLPTIKPHITRVERYGGCCSRCQQSYESPVPVGLEPGSPFGPQITSLLTYLRYHHAVSYQRLTQMMSEVFGLSISEGAIANALRRVQGQLRTPMAQIVERLHRGARPQRC